MRRMWTGWVVVAALVALRVPAEAARNEVGGLSFDLPAGFKQDPAIGADVLRQIAADEKALPGPRSQIQVHGWSRAVAGFDDARDAIAVMRMNGDDLLLDDPGVAKAFFAAFDPAAGHAWSRGERLVRRTLADDVAAWEHRYTRVEHGHGVLVMTLIVPRSGTTFVISWGRVTRDESGDREWAALVASVRTTLGPPRPDADEAPSKHTTWLVGALASAALGAAWTSLRGRARKRAAEAQARRDARRAARHGDDDPPPDDEGPPHAPPPWPTTRRRGR